MLSNRDVINEGFRPLKRTPTEPVTLAKSSHYNKNLSFNAKTGEAEPCNNIWEQSAWSRLERSKGKVLARPNSFVGSRGPLKEENRAKQSLAVGVVDPFSTGAHLAADAAAMGYRVIRILSIWDSPVAALVQEGIAVDYTATIQHNDQMEDQTAALQETVDALSSLPYTIVCVIPGAETGVELADSISEAMKLRSNGTAGSLARRNKYHMGERVRSAGVRAVKQRMCRTLAELNDFLDTLPTNPFKCVVKPVQSAGTDDVFLCSCRDEALIAFTRINGLVNDGALAQEFLAGKEYVIDKVSRNGEHKLVAIWEYDKRKCNNANFVYFGMRLQDPNSEKFRIMSTYADSVLNALGIYQGPSHMEVMWCADGVCLVEVGSRCHGGEGTWIPVAKECIGYTMVDVTLDVYLNGGLFDKIKHHTYTMKKFGADVDMVSRHSGIIRGFPGDVAIRQLESFRSISWEVKEGAFQEKTIDCFTRPGCVQLVNASLENLNRDFELLHALEERRLLDYSFICPKPPNLGAVVVVDPFSTGANLAALVAQWGFRLILVFSEKDSPVSTLVAHGTNLKPMLLIQHDNMAHDQEKALKETLKSIEEYEVPVVAILPGAETGVELAELLASRFGTRSNGEEYIDTRRNKYNMQEAVGKAGLRSARQRLCYSEDDVKSFYNSLKHGNEQIFVVVKPNCSAGSDGVRKCGSVEEAVTAFYMINGIMNGLGQINNGALVQEFLVGPEFVVDGVSRDGNYKVMAVWQYDKRSVNNHDFVYYGMHLIPIEQREMTLINYAAKVVEALHIYNGPTHMEVILTSTGPCLVEVGCRCHGGEASWQPIAEACIGYTQLDMTLNCYVRPDRFDAIPSIPTSVRGGGADVFIVSTRAGRIVDTPGLEKVRALKSFRKLELATQVGDVVHCTVDCFSIPGIVQMINMDTAQLAEDIAAFREIEKNFFTLE